jgi:4-alpha-glucanotransferase
MGLHRLYWIPDGLPATDGVYVRSPAEELYAVLAEEAHRAGTAVVGEDLGTVPPGVRSAMRRHGVLRSHVLQLEALMAGGGDPLPAPPRGSLASLNTHDMPPFAGFWNGGDIDDRFELGLIDAEERRRQEQERRELRRALTERFRAEGLVRGRGVIAPAQEAADAAHSHLARSRWRIKILNLEDLCVVTEPQKWPGT